MSYLVTGRSNVGNFLKTKLSEVRNSAYFVRRGPIDWNAHDWKAKPRAVAVIIDDCTFLRQINEASVSFEVFAAIPKDGDNIDDTLTDELFNDAALVLNSLVTEKDSNGDSIATLLPKSELAIECYDMDLKIQGLIITFTIKY